MSGRDPFSTPPPPAPDAPADFSPGTSQSGGAGQSTGGKAEEMTGKAQDKASEMTGKAQDKASEITGKAEEMGGKAQEKADQGIDAAASGLGQAAGKLRQQGEQREGAVGDAAVKTAETFDSASQYLKGKDTTQLMNDLEDFVRQKPVESLLIAAGIGIVLSKIVR